MDLSDLRQEYADRHLDLDHTEENPYRQFERWYKEAESAELLEPNAMVLGTIDSKLRSCQRTVLLKSFDERGFVFYTNYGSRKEVILKPILTSHPLPVAATSASGGGEWDGRKG